MNDEGRKRRELTANQVFPTPSFFGCLLLEEVKK
jgi:hypothetical protein